MKLAISTDETTLAIQIIHSCGTELRLNLLDLIADQYPQIIISVVDSGTDSDHLTRIAQIARRELLTTLIKADQYIYLEEK